MYPQEQYYLLPYLHSMLKSIATQVPIQAWSKYAGVSESSLERLIGSKNSSHHISFVKAALLFETVSIPIENAIKVALEHYDKKDPPISFLAQCPARTPFVESHARSLYAAILKILSGFIKMEINGISTHYQLGLKLNMRGSHVARYFTSSGYKRNSAVGDFGIYKLVQISRAFDTNLPDLITVAKMSILRSSSVTQQTPSLLSDEKPVTALQLTEDDYSCDEWEVHKL